MRSPVKNKLKNKLTYQDWSPKLLFEHCNTVPVLLQIGIVFPFMRSQNSPFCSKCIGVVFYFLFPFTQMTTRLYHKIVSH